MNHSYPSLKDFAAHLALDLNAIEIVKQPLYDYNVYPTAGLALMSFFAFAQGAGLSASPGNVGAVKQLSDTNLILASQLPMPQAFWCDGIEVVIDPGSSAAANNFSLLSPSTHVAAAAATVQSGENDVSNLYSSGALTFTVSLKPYYQEGPLYRFPTRHALRLDTAIDSNSATAAEDLKAKINLDGELMRLHPGIGIESSQNFGVNLTWPVVVTTPSGFNARVGIILNGWLFRGVQ